MKKILSLLFILVAGLHYQVAAQIFPRENSKLNYTLIGFSFPAVKGVSNYTLEIAMGNYNKAEEFSNNITITLKTTTNRVLAEVPSFGKEYTWRIVNADNGKAVTEGMHHFSSIISSEVDTTVTRLNILKSAEKYRDAHVFVDGAGALYDMTGNPVWYLPATAKLNPKKSKLWDMKLTPQGTITCLLDQNIYELNYNGDVLWKGPNNGKVSGDSIEYYHHEFTKLGNGHYVVLGTEFLSWTLPASPGGCTAIGPDEKNKTGKERTAFGTIIEYDHNGNVVWSWRSSEYFKKMDPKYLRADLYDVKSGKQMVDVHENAFYFDEKASIVYLSFKNISTILKIKYPEGNVLNVYGKLADNGNRSFCGQHSCKTTPDGHLYLYNNNACQKDALPKIMLFDQPEGQNDTLKKIWEYACTFEDVMAEKQKEALASNGKNDIVTPQQLSALGVYSKGGNLVELPDHSIFASICGIYGKMFIVTRRNEVIWSAIPEIWNPYQRKWEDIINYKSNIIVDPKDLEQLIWNSEK